ncbi:MAG: XRE family transcriptional regulator [Clostridia bacterium]
MDKNYEIAERLKGIREMEDISAAEMAKFAGISLELYLQYESGEKDFSFTLLYNCAKRLDMDITELVDGSNSMLSGYSIVRAGHGMPLRRREGFEYLHIAQYMKHRIADPFVVTAPYFPAEQDKPIPLSSHDGQEMDFVLQGSLKCNINGNIEILHAGDCLYYDSSKPHGMIASDGDKCVFLAIVMRKD